MISSIIKFLSSARGTNINIVSKSLRSVDNIYRIISNLQGKQFQSILSGNIVGQLGHGSICMDAVFFPFRLIQSGLKATAVPRCRAEPVI